MNKNLFKKIMFGVAAFASAMTISSCSQGACSPESNGGVSLKIVAPYQYPAGIPVTAYLTMYNTSKT
ncbi:MAG: hypothetical protein EKK64_08650 [Neisseriaceae bacterium]|nr:MAG: hypothetical protein EKK64_08650 [Neisseriaceae bacterium]